MMPVIAMYSAKSRAQAEKYMLINNRAVLCKQTFNLSHGCVRKEFSQPLIAQSPSQPELWRKQVFIVCSFMLPRGPIGITVSDIVTN